jgi:hypothetical protein
MPLTTTQQLNAININKELKTQINSLTSTIAQDVLCIPIAASYISLVKVVNAIAAPVGSMKQEIINTIDNITTPILGAISESLDLVSATIGTLSVPMITSDTINALNIFNRICLDFDDILPNAMKELLSEGAELVTASIAIPDGMVNMIEDAESFFKNNALMDMFDDAIKAILLPILLYKEFIKDTGIIELLKRLQKFERCMINPNTCNRPRKEVLFPGTNKYNSQYYMDLFCINLKGEVQLGMIHSQISGIENKMSRILTKLDNFK